MSERLTEIHSQFGVIELDEFEEFAKTLKMEDWKHLKKVNTLKSEWIQWYLNSIQRYKTQLISGCFQELNQRHITFIQV